MADSLKRGHILGQDGALTLLLTSCVNLGLSCDILSLCFLLFQTTMYGCRVAWTNRGGHTRRIVCTSCQDGSSVFVPDAVLNPYLIPSRQYSHVIDGGAQGGCVTCQGQPSEQPWHSDIIALAGLFTLINVKSWHRAGVGKMWPSSCFCK